MKEWGHKGMEVKRLGRTNLKVKRIGLGGMTLPQVSKKQAVETINKALDLDVNFIDTARAYGNSEERIGEVMKNRRQECFLSSRSPTYNYRGIEQDIEKSLVSLQTDYIDIYESHDVSTTDKYEQILSEDGALNALKKARRKGKIRFIGFSSHNWELTKKLIRTDEFDVALIVYNLADRAVEEVIPLAKEYDVGLFVMKVFGNGRLLEQTPAGSVRRPTIEECLHFALSNEDLPLILTGVKSPEEIAQNVSIAKRYSPLTAEEDKNIRDFGDNLSRGYCYTCSYCLPCPVEINIPVIMRLLEAKERRNWHTVHPDLRQQYNKLSKTIRDCIECGECEKKCPQHLPIQKRLREADMKFREI